MTRRNWKRIQPTSLKQAMELCVEHAREVKGHKVEAIAELMGLDNHWIIYKWVSNGTMPARYIRAFEYVCGIDYVTRWQAASAGYLVIKTPVGRKATADDMHTLQEVLNAASGQLLQFYGGKADAADVLAAIQQGMEGLAWHKGNVEKHQQPEFEFKEE